MASIIRIKRSDVSGNPTVLAAGEVAYSAFTGAGGDRMYVGMGTETNGDAANHVVIGGKYFTDKLDHALGTLTANSAILVDANSKIDQLKVDNLTIDGNTITATDVNGDIDLRPNGTGIISVGGFRIEKLPAPVNDSDAANKLYVDTQVSSGTLTVGDDAGASIAINLQTDDFNFAGLTGLTTSVVRDGSNDTFVNVNLDDTTVTAGSYGNETNIPNFTVDAQGRLTAAGTTTIQTILSMTGDSSSSDTISIRDSDINFAGTAPMNAIVTDNTVTISANRATTTDAGVAYFDANDFNVAGDGKVELEDVVIKNISTDTGVMAQTGHSIAILGGEGMDVTHSGNDITVTGEYADSANKGIASFDNTDFTVASGVVTANTITLGSSSLNNGETTTAIAGLTELTVDNININGNTISSTDASNTLYLDPAPTNDDGGTLIIRGNLQVEGSQTIINSSALSINDLNIIVADSAGNAAAADGAGITVGGASYTGTNPTMTFDGATSRWDFNYPVDLNDSIGAGLFFNGVSATEAVEDHLVNNVFLAGEGVDLTYSDVANTLTFSNEFATLTNAGIVAFSGYADGDSVDAAGTVRQFNVNATGNVWLATVDGGIY